MNQCCVPGRQRASKWHEARDKTMGREQIAALGDGASEHCLYWNPQGDFMCFGLLSCEVSNRGGSWGAMDR